MHLDARNNSLVAKENEIQKLQAQNQKLNNFRYVLDHRIKQLLTEKGPMAAHVDALENHIQQMYNEYVQKFNEEQVTQQSIQQKDMKINSLSNEVKNLRQSVIERERRIEGLTQAITRLAKEIEPSDLLDELKKVYRIYIKHEKAALSEPSKKNEDTDSLLPPAGQEIARHRDALIINLDGMAKRLEAADMRSKQFSTAKMNENSLLINECNKLRKTLEDKNRKIGELQEKITKYEREMGVLPKVNIYGKIDYKTVKSPIKTTTPMKKSKTNAILKTTTSPKEYNDLKPNASTGEIRKGTNKPYYLLSEYILNIFLDHINVLII